MRLWRLQDCSLRASMTVFRLKNKAPSNNNLEKYTKTKPIKLMGFYYLQT